MNPVPLSDIARLVLEKRYLARNYRGEILETPEDLFRRVARAVAEADRLFEAQAAVSATAEEFEAAIASLSFMPNSPCLMHAGRPLGQLAACFVLPVEDNLEAIFQTLKDTALIHQTGGGTGFSFSKLRPRGDTIFPASGVAGGPLSFIQLFDNATYLIDRHRVRPGANMGVLPVNHPDIEEFIRSKETAGILRNFNISVAIDDEFIRCLKNGADYPLLHPRTGVAVGRKDPSAILDRIVESAWRSGDPGLLFLDRINQANPTPRFGRLEATNPCGEQPLLPYESCTLGSINLTKIIRDGDIDLTELARLAKLAVHFLDNVIEINRYPLRQVEEWSRTNRKIGLGVMGFADLLILLGVPYRSERAAGLAERIMACIQAAAEAASAELAERRGNFPAFEHSIFPGKGIRKRRNATLTTVAPTGTISLIAGVSSGIEPVFCFETERRVVDTIFKEVHPIYDRFRREGKPIPKDIFQSAWDIDPEWHLEIQAVFQKFTDNAVSKTVNVPQSATPEDIRKLFMRAVELKVKGITVYRDQSIENQILSACSVKREECS
ncbi:MAG: adenosylcobalamin-dependent ribonucleoside-diphosphate reductase [Thermodesulfobacteriota bacterium]